ncbi:LuxR C-terminal-related transcriptional regulator [Paenarthrobacter sp. NCHU4564]|uniref:LuxR C-terminal-related transcriptional regulator n=1 Tax=Paenarthrobacter sp. NCHU4564 TaxID=3451353 RepID=UPI003F9CF017
MPDVPELLTEAREAFARGEWDAARRRLEEAAGSHLLDLVDRSLLARARWWQGDVQGSMSLAEGIFQELAGQGLPAEAARSALLLSMQWGLRGNIPVSSAWLARARRLLEPLPVSVDHGYLLYLEGSDALYLDGMPAAAQSAAARLKDMAGQFQAPELGSFASLLSGLSHVRNGNTAQGFVDLDEALLPVLAGQVPVEWAGDIYCSVIHLCYEMEDFARMRAWTDALADWCAALSTTFMYAGIASVHQLQLAAAEGHWKQAEDGLLALGGRLRHAHGWIAAECFSEAGEIRRRRGDAEGARAAFDSARSLGHDGQPGSALLWWDAGRTDLALGELRAALAERETLGRMCLLLPLVELLAPLDTASAALYCLELEEAAATFGTPGFVARARRARGAVLMAQLRWAQACAELDAAAEAYRKQRRRYELAEVHEHLALARRGLRDDDLARAEEATAAAIRAQLGAAPPSRLGLDPDVGGLTPRELEVLACVLSGASNRDIAHALTISEKTAGRHLANIFTKIGVTSRTAAAAWARHHGIRERHAPESPRPA